MDKYLERAEELKESVVGNYEHSTNIQDYELVGWLIEQAETLQKIKEGRINDGKTSGNDYIVINRDEPYINEIIKILANNGHWDGEVLGECGWCGAETNELSGPHMMDFVPGEKMCRVCWNHDRETYLGSVGTDIGEFKPSGSK